MKVFLVLEFTGAHAPAPVWSICTSRELAESNADKLRADIDSSIFEVREVELDKLNDGFMNWPDS